MPDERPEDNTSELSGTVDEAATADAVDALASLFGESDEEDDPNNPSIDGDDSDDSEDEVIASDDGEEESTEDDQDEDEDDSEDESDEDVLGEDARVRLKDGTVTTVSDLEQGNLRQSDYTRKAQAVAEEKQAIDAERQRVQEHFQQLEQQFAFVNHIVQNAKPKPPEGAPSDNLIAHAEYADRLRKWEEFAGQWHQNYSEQMGKAEEEQTIANQEYLQKEKESLVLALPQLADREKHATFLAEMATIGEEYGFSKEEIYNTTDHRVYKAFKDLMELRRMKKRAPKVRTELNKKPKLLKGSRRVSRSQKARNNKARNMKVLSQEQSLEAGARAIEDLL